MPATVTIRRRTGTGGGITNTDVTAGSTLFSLSDVTSPGTSDPCQIPSAATNYSYWMSLYLQADTTPAGTIDAVEVYSDGASGFGAGITTKVTTANAYTQATGSATSGTQLVIGNYAGISPSPPNDLFGYTSGAALSVPGSINNPSTGLISDFVVLQQEGTSSVVPGSTPTETLTFKYDET
jgi:hypothetical protein